MLVAGTRLPVHFSLVNTWRILFDAHHPMKVAVIKSALNKGYFVYNEIALYRIMQLIKVRVEGWDMPEKMEQTSKRPSDAYYFICLAYGAVYGLGLTVFKKPCPWRGCNDVSS